MFKSGFILISLLVISLALPIHASPAKTDTACQTIDNVLGTVSLVREIQLTQSGKNLPRQIAELETLTIKIALPALVPPQARDGLASEHQALFTYLARLREAIAGAKSGYDDYARQILDGAASADFERAIQSLELYWHCKPETSSPDTKTENSNAKPAYLGESGSGAKTASIGLSRPFAETSPSRDRPTNNHLSKQVKFALPTLLSNASFLFPLTVLVILASIFMYAQKRSKKQKVREARRFIYKPVKIRIGKKVSTSMVVDISMNGAKLQHQSLIKNQRRISIKLDDSWYAGQIKWSNNLFAGVKFDKPISPQSLNQLLQTS